jgi:EAL domain-containing protein (putative c-di-GMP-specific phosphodiesterase class I)
VSKLLGEFELPPERLEIELTERVLVDSSPQVDKTLEELSGLGVRISLDDFGKGYASLDYLRRYPLDKVKIDQSFVYDIETDFKNATIVGAVIDLAAKLGLVVVAEGVEPREILDRLAAQGCEQVQGFYFSKPRSPADFETLFTTGSDRINPH